MNIIEILSNKIKFLENRLELASNFMSDEDYDQYVEQSELLEQQIVEKSGSNILSKKQHSNVIKNAIDKIVDYSYEEEDHFRMFLHEEVIDEEVEGKYDINAIMMCDHIYVQLAIVKYGYFEARTHILSILNEELENV